MKLKTIIKIITLLGMSLCQLAHASLDYSGKTLIFTADSSNEIKSITYTNNSAEDILVIAANFSTLISNDNFTIDYSNCINKTLIPTESCSVFITYSNQLAGKQSAYYVFASPDNAIELPIFVANYFDETDAKEANRRISPIVESVEILNGDGSVASVEDGLIADTTYKLKWTVMSYTPLKGSFYLLNCSNEIDRSNCAITFDSQSELANEELSGSVLSDSTAVSSGYEVYHYNNQKAIHQEFISTSFQVSSLVIGTEKYLGLRFYSRGEESNSLGDVSNVSTLLSSKLNIQAQEGDSFLGNDGRRIKLKLAQ